MNNTFVLIVSPGGTGGISRMVGYLSREFKNPRNLVQHQIIYTWMWGPYSISDKFRKLFSALYKVVWLCLDQKISIAHIHVSSKGSTARKLIIFLILRIFSIPVILHLHGSHYDIFYRNSSYIIKLIIRKMFFSADKVITLGRVSKDFIQNEMQVLPDRVEVVHNGTPPMPANFGATFTTSSMNILFLGILGDRKGVPELIQALASPKLRELNWRATIAGHGEIDRFRELSIELGIDHRIEFPGSIGKSDVRKLLSTSFIFVLPSHNEGLPMSILEAMSYGLAIVTTPVGSITDAVENEVTGLIVPSGDIDALVDAIYRFLGDSNLRQKLGKRAQEIFMEKFDIKICAEKISLIYKSVL